MSDIDKQKLADVFFQLSKACQDMGTILLQDKQPQNILSTPIVEPLIASSVISKSPNKKTVSSKKEKDPNAPKKPLSAYMIFFQENYYRLAKENEQNAKGVIEISKLVSELWKKVDHSSYENKAKELKEQYALVLSEYNKTKAQTSDQVVSMVEKREAEPINAFEDKPNKKIKREKAAKEHIIPSPTIEKEKKVEEEQPKAPNQQNVEEISRETKRKEKKEKKNGNEVQLISQPQIPSSPTITDSQSTVMSTVDSETGQKKKEKKKHHHHKHVSSENKLPSNTNV